MIGRRALLKAVAGVGFAAPVVSPTSVLSAASAALGATGAASGILDNTLTAARAPGSSLLWKIRRGIDCRREVAHLARTDRMPAYIASKRSWSPAFKEHVRLEELEAERRLLEALEQDEALADRIAELLGIEI